jgi:hypothetical protein
MFPAIVNVVIGIALLTTGRKLFWLFMSAVGFILGRSLAQQLLVGNPAWTVIFIAVATGLVGLIFGLYAQRFAVGLAGFLMGHYALVSLGLAIGFFGTGWIWLALVGGGIIGATLALVSLDFAFIFLTCVAGAKVIEQTIDLNPLMSFALFTVLFGVGVTMQLIMLRK